jgi:hypothetical protein
VPVQERAVKIFSNGQGALLSLNLSFLISASFLILAGISISYSTCRKYLRKLLPKVTTLLSLALLCYKIYLAIMDLS